jgi:hypothetical protein
MNSCEKIPSEAEAAAPAEAYTSTPGENNDMPRSKSKEANISTIIWE